MVEVLGTESVAPGAQAVRVAARAPERGSARTPRTRRVMGWVVGRAVIGDSYFAGFARAHRGTLRSPGPPSWIAGFAGRAEGSALRTSRRARCARSAA